MESIIDKITEKNRNKEENENFTLINDHKKSNTNIGK